jgi:hypothetical protein
VKTITLTLATLMMGASPAAFAQPMSPGYGGQGYPPPGQGYQQQTPTNQGYGPQGEPNSAPMDQQFQQSQSDYAAQLREYHRQKREYERQRAAYEAQFGSETGPGGAPPPPMPPAPPPAWQGGRAEYNYSETIPFRNGPWQGGQHARGWYRHHGCRLAVPRSGWQRGAGQYVAVCPDADGGYSPAA